MMENRTKIIAEIGANHMGDMRIAEAMVRTAASAGVDIVKFQSWRADKLQKNFPDYAAAFERHERTQISDEDHRALIRLCAECGVEFLTTCFDVERVDFLASLGLKRIKIASPDCESFKLIDKLINAFPHVIISTGMTTDEEVIRTVEHVRGANVTFMHCVSAYPAPLELSNLKRMEWMRSLGVDVGFSDHSHGYDVAKMAIVMGTAFPLVSLFPLTKITFTGTNLLLVIFISSF